MTKNIYESDIYLRLPHRSMHPGGLRLTDRAVRLAGLQPGMLVADIGCGTGVSASYLADRYKLNMVGFDVSDALVGAGLKSNPRLKLIRWDCQTLPLEEASLDAILFECTLSVIGSSDRLLAESFAALKPSGKLILSDICSSENDSGDADSPMTPVALEQLLRRTGFTVTFSEDHTPALRTYAAELREHNGGDISSCALPHCAKARRRLSDLGYHLIIASKL